MNNNLTPVVSEIGRLNITGNVIPANWWHHIKMPSGKPDSTGIVLLSEIIYWYRPTEIRDEFTGELQGWRKRFQSDKLQRSYQSFADQFGFTKREVTEAIKRLKSKGVITLEFRTIKTANGPCNNVVFIEPVVECINEITNSSPLVNNQTKIKPVSVIGITSKRDRGYVETEQPPHTEVIAPTSKRETNTEITTESTTENINPSCQVVPQPNENIDDKSFVTRHPDAVVYSAKKRQWGTADDLLCAQWMSKRVMELYQQASGSDSDIALPKEPNWALWANDVRLMCSIDGRTHKQICQLFNRVNKDPFWSKNILSPSTLRKQWDKLALKFAETSQGDDCSSTHWNSPEAWENTL